MHQPCACATLRQDSGETLGRSNTRASPKGSSRWLHLSPILHGQTTRCCYGMEAQQQPAGSGGRQHKPRKEESALWIATMDSHTLKYKNSS
jgi:hypothetical protein